LSLLSSGSLELRLSIFSIVSIMENDFQRVLSAIGTAPLRCILIDGLDWAGIDQDKKRILNDIILAVQRYNEEHKKRGEWANIVGNLYLPSEKRALKR